MRRAVWVAILAGGAASAQSFEVATVKVGTARTLLGVTGGPGTADPERWSCPDCMLAVLLGYAYEIRGYQLSAPEWGNSDRFQVTAKVPAGASREQFRAMLRQLLAERFRMTVHREKKEMPVYDLVVAKSGIKMTDTGAGPPPPAPGNRPETDRDGFPNVPGGSGWRAANGRGRMEFRQQTMANLANLLSAIVGRPVIDATGLTSKYAFAMSWYQETNGPGPASGGPVPEARVPEGPSIFQAMQDQLGLKLEGRKGSVEMLVVDRAERKPVEN